MGKTDAALKTQFDAARQRAAALKQEVSAGRERIELIRRSLAAGIDTRDLHASMQKIAGEAKAAQEQTARHYRPATGLGASPSTNRPFSAATNAKAAWWVTSTCSPAVRRKAATTT